MLSAPPAEEGKGKGREGKGRRERKGKENEREGKKGKEREKRKRRVKTRFPPLEDVHQAISKKKTTLSCMQVNFPPRYLLVARLAS